MNIINININFELDIACVPVKHFEFPCVWIVLYE